jgi:hypothetical protein
MASNRKLSTLDKLQIAGYVARMAKREIAGEHVYTEDLKRKVDRVIDRAEKRTKKPRK